MSIPSSKRYSTSRVSATEAIEGSKRTTNIGRRRSVPHDGLSSELSCETGYDTLTSLVPDGEFGGILLITAQDMLFKPDPPSAVAAEASEVRDAMGDR
jgi:hypothetical protein